MTSSPTPAAADAWYIVRQADGACDLCTASALDTVATATKTWGPFPSQAEAIARRVGLIRAGHCLPQ